MGELVELLAKSLVDSPDAVQVNEIEEDTKSIIIELSVDPEDMGKVIGKRGKIAKSIRTLTKSMAIKENKRVIVKIIE